MSPEEWSELIDKLGGFGVAIAVLIALFGYAISHALELRRQRVEARLRFKADQLERLYGPLYSLVQANTASFEAFRRTFRPGRPMISPENPFSDRERVIWKAWAEHVFIPSNLRIRDVIERHAHLVEGGRMPEPFLKLIAHVESSKLVLPSIADGDISVLDEFEPWPSDFNAYVEESYLAVAEEHSRLLGRVFRRGSRS